MRRQRPTQVANEKDLYRLDMPGADPAVIESELWCGIEDQVVPALKQVIARGQLATEELPGLLNLVAMLAARMPQFRHGSVRLLEQRCGLPLSDAVRDAGSWELVFRFCEEAQLSWPEDFTSRFFNSPGYSRSA